MDKVSLTKKYFKQTANSYKDIDDDDGFQYKVKHSSRVAKAALKIAEMENLDTDLSYIIGLLHDIGRFEQIRQNFSFQQDHVFDHGDCSEEMFLASDLKDHFSAKEQFIIAKALKNHNKLAIEEGLDDETLIYCKMIRDADKVDILKVIADRMPYPYDEVSPEVVEDFNKGELVKTLHVKTKQDHLINMMSYVYDINFNSTRELMKDNLETLKSFCIHLDKLRDF